MDNITNQWHRVKAILDANRNSLMLLELKVSIGTLGLAVGTLISALYGMNLKNFIEESDLGFGAVSATCFAATIFVCVYGLLKLRRVQRVRMWGEGGIQDPYMGGLGLRGSSTLPARGSWRSDAMDPTWTGLPAEGRAQRMRKLRNATANGPSSTAASPSSSTSKRSDQSCPTGSRSSKSPTSGSSTKKEVDPEIDRDTFQESDSTMAKPAYGSSR